MQHRHDLVSHVVRFCRSLRKNGLLVGPSETADAIQSLGLVDLMDRGQVYWAFRTVLVSRPDEIEAFDACFYRFWTFRRPENTSPQFPGLSQAGSLRNFARRVNVGSSD